jgi:peptidoglycan/LPS O-acetylase OafA/YrhL
MTATSIAPCLVLCAAFVGLGALIVAWWPSYRDQAGPVAPGKLETLDGLRAFLALGVFFHHGVITYYWVVTGVWGFPPDRFYREVGTCAVQLFFMITGFLFWTKAIRGSASLPAGKLLVGRVFRIAPMYLFISALVYGTIIAQSGFRLRGTTAELATGLASPLALGLIKWMPINGVAPGPMNAEVNWTLQLEWGFYLLLPILAILATPRRFLVLALAAIVMLPWSLKIPYYWNSVDFLAGMAAAHFIQSFGQVRALAGRFVAVASLASVAILPGLDVLGYRSSLVVKLLALAFLFLCVVNGNSFFGVLRSRGAKLLGTISYSLYLTHGFVLYLGRSTLARWLGHDEPSAVVFWAFLAACGAITILGAACTYRFVELPFIERSHRLGRRLPAARPPAALPDAIDAASTAPDRQFV